MSKFLNGAIAGLGMAVVVLLWVALAGVEIPADPLPSVSIGGESNVQQRGAQAAEGEDAPQSGGIGANRGHRGEPERSEGEAMTSDPPPSEHEIDWSDPPWDPAPVVKSSIPVLRAVHLGPRRKIRRVVQ